ncbi:MAG: uncharacterized protein QOF78_4015 [Phycisphaerales bacterium]|jgi:endogenous inhibitor of DNA gyrase (YacG/DUF329 family)|nr:uncharacterized protein [Phycisphaerales bacterium]
MLCPICKKPIDDARPGDERSKHLPFCSDRCKLIDLGRWLDGKYQVPVDVDEQDDAAADRDPFRRGTTPR